MPFALGVAIKNLFDRIAQLLTLPPLPGSIPPPGSGGGGGGTGGGGQTGGGGGPAAPSPPGPSGPPPIVQVPGGGPLSPGGPPPEDCPILSYSDRLALYGLQFGQDIQQGSFIPPYLPQTYPEDQMLSTVGLGTPVDANDVFRFRAISTTDNVPVSFFGRIQSKDGTITPFIRVLNTSTPNTLFETSSNTGPGLLLGAAASVPVGSITTGSVNAIGEIGRVAGSTFTPHTVLFSGQVDDQQALDSNLATPSTPVGRGTILQASNTTPTAQALSVTITPTTGKRFRILTVSGTCNNSANVANRQVSVLITANSGVTMRFPSNSLTVASQIVQLRASINGQPNASVSAQVGLGLFAGIPLPESLYFYEQTTVEVNYFSFTTGDTVASIFVGYEET